MGARPGRALNRQNAEHYAENQQQTQVVAAADANLAHARAVVAAPLVEPARPTAPVT